jgi:hypothetical protein
MISFKRVTRQEFKIKLNWNSNVVVVVLTQNCDLFNLLALQTSLFHAVCSTMTDNMSVLQLQQAR